MGARKACLSFVARQVQRDLTAMLLELAALGLSSGSRYSRVQRGVLAAYLQNGATVTTVVQQ